MQALNSEWLIARIERSAREPRQRLLNAFDIVAEHLTLSGYRLDQTWCEEKDSPHKTLPDFLTQQALTAGIEAPETLAQLLHIMLIQAALAEQSQPDSKALQHAKVVAAAMLETHTKKPRRIRKPVAYSMAAGVFSVLGAASLLLHSGIGAKDIGASPPYPATPLPLQAMAASASSETALANPAKTAAIYASIERMREGMCYFPQALILPADQRAIYIENIVKGQISSNVSEQQVVDKLMEQVTCNYSPMLMKNSTG